MALNNTGGSIDAVFEKVRGAIKRRGEFGIRDLARTFKIYDDNNSHTLNKEEFKKGLTDYGLRLSQGEVDLIFDHFDMNDDNEITYDEFVITLRGEMNDTRKAVVKKAFAKMDVTGDGVVTSVDIKKTYNARNHPAVKDAKKTEEQVLKDFLDNFDQNKDGTLTYEEFEKYYAGISASIDSDPYFTTMMFSAWKL